MGEELPSDDERKIRELAHTLKSLHLAGTMEEAEKRAREMVKGVKGEEKTSKEI